MGHPSQHDFENLVGDQMMLNCPVTYHDVTNDYKIFGPDLAGPRGKTVCKRPEYNWSMLRYQRKS